MLSGARQRARKKGIEFNIELDDIPDTPSLCPILEIPLRVNEGFSGWHDNSPSLDRIKSDGGYVKGNVRIISNRANRLKCDGTLEELEKIVADARLPRH